MSFELEKIATDVERIAESMSEGGGGSGGVLVVNFNTTTEALDKTWREIHDALLAVIIMTDSDGETLAREHALVVRTLSANGIYMVTAVGGEAYKFNTDSEDGHPAMQSQVQPSN